MLNWNINIDYLYKLILSQIINRWRLQIIKMPLLLFLLLLLLFHRPTTTTITIWLISIISSIRSIITGSSSIIGVFIDNRWPLTGLLQLLSVDLICHLYYLVPIRQFQHGFLVVCSSASHICTFLAFMLFRR